MKLISDCSECVIKTYMACRFHNNFKGIILEGEPTQEELQNAFEEIETEYNDLCGEASDELKLAWKYTALVARNKAVELGFWGIDLCLQYGLPWLEVLPKLKENNVRINWNGDIDDFKRQVENAKIKNITKEVELEELKKALDTLQEKDATKPAFTKKDFYHRIHAARALGFKVVEHETNMFDFGVACGEMFQLQKTQKPN